MLEYVVEYIINQEHAFTFKHVKFKHALNTFIHKSFYQILIKGGQIFKGKMGHNMDRNSLDT